MTRMDDLRQSATPFDRFLYADVGADRNGNSVSMLSALARLGLNPWDEAADLSKLAPDGAEQRLGGLLAGLADVPSLNGDRSRAAQRLIALLPRPATLLGPLGAATSASVVRPDIGTILAILVVLLLIAQAVFLGSGGPGG